MSRITRSKKALPSETSTSGSANEGKTSNLTPSPQPPASSWDVTGSYRVEFFWPEVDSSSYSLYIHPASDSHDDCEYYAAFQFDKLEGIMRLCPQPEQSDGNHPSNDLEFNEFEEACRLVDNTTAPSPDCRHWLMQWRGADGGLRLGKKVGGEGNWVHHWKDDIDDSPNSGEFQGIRIRFYFAFDGRAFGINAKKIASLPTSENTMLPSKLREDWKDRWNSDWNLDSVSESNAESDTEPAFDLKDLARTLDDLRNDFRSNFGLNSALGGEIVGTMRLFPIPRFGTPIHTAKELEEACVLRSGCWPGPGAEAEAEEAKPQGCNSWCAKWRGEKQGRVEVQDEDNDCDFDFKRDSSGKLTASGLFMNGLQPIIFEAEKIRDLPPSSGREPTVSAAWSLWKLEGDTSSSLESDWEILWNTAWVDYSESEGSDHLDSSDNVERQPAYKKPYTRRAYAVPELLQHLESSDDDGPRIGSSFRNITNTNVRKTYTVSDPSQQHRSGGQDRGSLSNVGKDQAQSGPKSKPQKQSREREEKSAAERGHNALKTLSRRKAIRESATDGAPSGGTSAETPKLPSAIIALAPEGQALPMDSPILGILLNDALSEYSKPVRLIEEQPAWAWDVTGYWNDLNASTISRGSGEASIRVISVHMVIWMSNNARHSKVGRQYHAKLEIPGLLDATVRFCPQPGPHPQGRKTWHLRWRGIGHAGEQEDGSDEIQTEVTFEQNGKLTLKGTFIYDDQEISLLFTKRRDIHPPKGNGATINSL
ncbi:uncharacterized protein LY89DRAFT_669805 [Mollisia scopiformis]|uniref:Uncharacterized protein n=1 Tax=Mollisia scopiformis TaxID=149040 RepID=A0A194X909_MOLSC|nr:uncharacterized protein LY89DRAFT_669805 [Mollisia scopiformis]KUJ16272.1 hypothetical protein LY89DRAFT_669805 [Mollisia scopiformis]